MWRRHLWTIFAILTCVSGEYLMGGHLDNNAEAKSRSGKIGSSSVLGHKTHVDDLDLDLVTEESTVVTVIAAVTAASSIDNDAPRYHIPYPFAFNGGKPFSLEKDPITGMIDFEKAPPVRALNYTSRYQEQSEENKERQNASEENNDDEEDTYLEQEDVKSKDNDVTPNEINLYTPNFHDFLNLPVHYSSDKYENDNYPLISSSYANTKVQSGANSYSTQYNHRPHHRETELYTHSIKNPYTKTSTYKATIINDIKTKWISAVNSTISPITRSSQTSTKEPIITTWKPSTAPSTFYSIEHTIADEEDQKNIPEKPIEKLQTSNYINNFENLNNVSASASINNEATEQSVIRYKDQATLNNFVLSHVGSETKLPVENEEYKDSYDTYDPTSDNEDDTDESDYFLPFRDFFKNNVTLPTPSTIVSSSTTASIDNNITNVIPDATITLPSATISTITSSKLPVLQEDLVINNPLIPQYPISSLFFNREDNQRQNITERREGITNLHEHKPTQIIKSGQDRVGAGIVIESTSNIVIPPDQDTVSFVLGNRQNVHADYYSVGTAIEENSYDNLSDIGASFQPFRDNLHESTKIIEHEQPLVTITDSNVDRITQKLWSPNSNVLKSNNKLELSKSQNSFGISSAILQNTINQNKDKNSSYVITYPLNTDEAEDKNAVTEEHYLIINEADGSIRELLPKTTTTTTTTITTMTTPMATATVTMKNKTRVSFPTNSGNANLPQLAENLMPPAKNPVPYYYNYQSDTLRPDHSRPQRLPLPLRGKPHSGPLLPPSDIGMRRRPYIPDTKLPNILPQFRPNAKTSHGHRGSDIIGTISAGQNLSTRIRQPLQNHPSSRRPLPPSPLYLQRLNPPPPPIHAVRLSFVPTSTKIDGVTLLHETEPTIRRLRPPESTISRGALEENTQSNRLIGYNVNEHKSENKEEENRNKSETKIEYENENSERYPEEPPINPPKPPLFPKRKTADPPHVTTLQMIQHHGEFGENEGSPMSSLHFVNINADEETGVPHLSQFAKFVKPVHEMERKKPDNYNSPTAEQPVYVVYPVNTAVNIHPDDSKEKDGSVVVGTRGPHRPLPPDTLLQDEREKAHIENKPVTLDFPYPLERPDQSSTFSATLMKETPLLVPSEQRQQTSVYPTDEEGNAKNEQDTINIIPYLQDVLPYQKKNSAAISVTLHRTTPTSTSITTSTSPSTSISTSTPIAYIYTPTHSAAHRLDDNVNVVANFDTTATQSSSSSNSLPAAQNFMAPFVASMSAETPTKNGWNVVVVEPLSIANKRIDNDNDDIKASNLELETQTEKDEFDADNFKPQLFGGFQPIYEFPTEEMEHRNIADMNTETDMPRHSKKLLPVPDKG